MPSKKMSARRTQVKNQLRREQPTTYKTPELPQRAPQISDTEKRLRALEFRGGQS